MTPPERLIITGPEDILGFIPHSLGYWPANSLVAMTMQGKRLGATLRVDLPDLDSGSGLLRFARTVRDYLEADHDADGALLVLFSNDGWFACVDTAPGSVPAGAPVEGTLAWLLAALEVELELSGLPVRDAWYVGEAFWRNAYCFDPSCCPFPGRSVDEIRDSRLNAEMVFRGSSVGEDPVRAACARFEGAGADLSVMESEESWAGKFVERRGSRSQFATILDAWECVLAADAGAHLPAELAGYLRATLCVPHWRDAVLVMSAAGRQAAEQGAEDFGIFDPDTGLQAVLPPVEGQPVEGQQVGGLPRGARPPACPADDAAHAVPGYGDVLLGLAPASPRWDRMRTLEAVLVQLGAAGGGESGAASLTARGWIEWCRGRGSFAHALLDQAVMAQPGYRLAELLSELVGRGTLCGWAGRRDAAWQKFEPDAA
ncbi:DUF4192 family protein [Arthrobacter oryzae]|jgi:hypothetical protein|uniref:DUF4192 family protein n=1 Tax=Arthrobacter oryzae TaxID=409290 RepID=UPI00278267BD|nr:DUF4192 family protein [Arthrobacter oryzae]MDQ0078135.1 hypothetical protein [Arthrobacter oryzae]